MKFARLLIKFFVAIGLYIGLQQLIELKTHGFCLQRILADDLPFQAKWETSPLSAEEELEVDSLLSQPYHMIGAGSECFAFASADGRAVIKFFKLDHTRPIYFHRGVFLEDHSKLAGTLSNHPLTHISSPPLKRFLGIREFRIERTFSSIHLAYENLRDETGLLYLHLNPTDLLRKTLTLYDACGIAHSVDLDTSKFFLQKRAIPLENHFAALQKKKAEAEAKLSIDSLVQLLTGRCKKGFSDRDIVNRNFGYIGTQAIEIDSGSFRKNSRMRQPWIYKQELFYATLELKSWLKKNYPEMVGYLEDKVTNEIFQDEN
jgi:hypothetical protein